MARPKKDLKLVPLAKPKDRFHTLSLNLTKHQIDGADEIAKAEKKQRAEVLRDAVDFYLLHYGKEQINLQETELRMELVRMEKRLVSLVMKVMRMTGQTVYWTTLPYASGPPKGRFSSAGFKVHWDRGLAFSALMCKQKSPADSTLPPQDPKPKEANSGNKSEAGERGDV